MALSQGVTVKALAERAGVSTDTVRHYVRIGLLRPKRDATNGYKLFFEAEMRRLKFIRGAQALGFSLDEIALILDLGNRGESPCPNVRQILQRHIDDNRARLEELRTRQARMEAVLKKWSDMPDGHPDDSSICHLIEKVSGLREF